MLASKGYWPVCILNSMTPSAVQGSDRPTPFWWRDGMLSNNALLYLRLYAIACTAYILLMFATEEMLKTLWEVRVAHKHMWVSSTAIKGCC